jgi:hypothetical protein
MATATTFEGRLEAIEAELTELRRLVEGALIRGPQSTTANGTVANGPLPGEPPKLGAEHPFARFAGTWRDDPIIDEWREAVEENRRKLDEEEGLP